MYSSWVISQKNWSFKNLPDCLYTSTLSVHVLGTHVTADWVIVLQSSTKQSSCIVNTQQVNNFGNDQLAVDISTYSCPI